MWVKVALIPESPSDCPHKAGYMMSEVFEESRHVDVGFSFHGERDGQNTQSLCGV